MTIFPLTSKLTFGQYGPKREGGALTVQEVIDLDPEYLAQAVDKIEWFELDDEAEAALDEATFVWKEYGDDYDTADIWGYDGEHWG